MCLYVCGSVYERERKEHTYHTDKQQVSLPNDSLEKDSNHLRSINDHLIYLILVSLDANASVHFLPFPHTHLANSITKLPQM